MSGGQRRRVRHATLALAVCLAALVTAPPALAHTLAVAQARAVELAAAPPLSGGRGSDELRQIRASSVPGDAPTALAAATLALLAAGAAARSRRTRAALLALLLAGLAVESAVHSVHHLDSDLEAARCVVAQATSHITALTAGPTCLDTPPPARLASDTGAPSTVRRAPRYRSDPGRAPPLAHHA